MSDVPHQQPLNALKCVCSNYVPVKQPLRSAEWWQNHFGLEYAVPYNPAEFQAILKLSDGQWLHLVETDGVIDNQFPNKSGYEMFRLTFEVRQIEQLYNRLQTKGVRTENLEDRGSCGINFVFYDLDGNKFDVNEVVHLHRTPEEAEKVKEHLFHVAL
ncbi:VOC family protein [Paenibacillus harenae]|uniref:Catechol 2,3-dioxygenase-like lactoylglutathione lyase family enzyme n=1 Tax=Paenibacillus harenae TaxID=306543 RepID=A0ABT9U9L3_PAEHA|nr:VOC family protein [Paenibacillus harenae]MDQ0116342.1 catechol 2,3-dioxygenase-like lactoylglutathione lyase family enzyme [Paenibacillus harenae]